MKLDMTRMVEMGCVCCLSLSLGGWTVRADANHGAATTSADTPPSHATADALASRKGADQTLMLIREASLALLKEGNARYATGKSRHPNQGPERRSAAVAEGQKPFATVLSCSDSRGPVEVLFDRGVGELFVVRVAGNVADESQVATIEYGVEHLGTPLLVVLGHTACGAVTAATKGGELHGHLSVLINRIKPAVAKARAIGAGPDRLVAAAIQANVWQQIEEILSSSSIVRNKVREGELQIVGGIYDLEKGTVAWMGSHPKEEAVIVQAEEEEKTAELARATKAARDAAAEHAAETPAVVTSHEEEESRDTEPAAAPAVRPLPSFPSSLLPSKEVKARTRTKPQDSHSEPHH